MAKNVKVTLTRPILYKGAACEVGDTLSVDPKFAEWLSNNQKAVPDGSKEAKAAIKQAKETAAQAQPENAAA